MPEGGPGGGWTVVSEIIFYQDVKDWSALRHRQSCWLIVQMESIHHLSIPPVDVCIIDEATSCLSEFSSKTMRKEYFKENLSKFEFLVKTAGKVLCMDANIDRRVMNII